MNKMGLTESENSNYDTRIDNMNGKLSNMSKHSRINQNEIETFEEKVVF